LKGDFLICKSYVKAPLSKLTGLLFALNQGSPTVHFVMGLRHNEKVWNIHIACLYFQEFIEQTINLEEDTPTTIERVLSFLYVRKYNHDQHEVFYQLLANPNSSIDDYDSNSPEEKLNDIETLKQAALSNIQVFVAADKFGIDPLKSLATDKFSQ
jgi:hypothetical protein